MDAQLAFWLATLAPARVEIALFSLASYAHYNAALLLLPDVVMTIRQPARLDSPDYLGMVFSAWLLLNAHTIAYTSEGRVG